MLEQRLTKYGAICFKRRSLLMQLFSMIVLASPSRQVPRTTVAAGLALTLIGFALRFWSTGYAGIATRTQSGVPPKRLIANGPFRYSRNPIYIGNQLMFAGTLLCIGQGLRCLLFSVPAFFFYSLIARYEEDLLAMEFGKKYEEYKKKTPRWLPRNLCNPFRSHAHLESADSTNPSHNGDGEFSWLRALQTERFTAYNCAKLLLLRRTSSAARQRLK
jgi:protein-S-isoprenylcysteine O-methyltransferase Ste14